VAGVLGANPGGWPLPSGPYLDENSTSSGQYVRFTPTLTTNGYYDVYAWWVYANNRASNVPFIIASASATNVVAVNEQINCTNWFKIASSNYFNVGTGGSVTITNRTSSGYISGYAIANAVRFMPLGSIAPSPQGSLPVVEVVASDALTGEFGTNQARFTVLLPQRRQCLLRSTVNYSVSWDGDAGCGLCRVAGQRDAGRRGGRHQHLRELPLGDNLNYQSGQTVSLSLAMLRPIIH
jgi:hypothetical protein